MDYDLSAIMKDAHAIRARFAARGEKRSMSQALKTAWITGHINANVRAMARTTEERISDLSKQGAVALRAQINAIHNITRWDGVHIATLDDLHSALRRAEKEA